MIFNRDELPPSASLRGKRTQARAGEESRDKKWVGLPKKKPSMEHPHTTHIEVSTHFAAGTRPRRVNRPHDPQHPLFFLSFLGTSVGTTVVCVAGLGGGFVCNLLLISAAMRMKAFSTLTPVLAEVSTSGMPNDYRNECPKSVEKVDSTIPRT